MPLFAQDQVNDFDLDASIVLIGLPGSGKSTLATILQLNLDWAVRESTQYLKTTFGQTPELLKKSVGPEAYSRRLQDAIAALFGDYERTTILVCDVATVQGASKLIRDFSKSHPVIYVDRDFHGITQHLQSWSHAKIEQMRHLLVPMLRNCANYEYYNITEHASPHNSSLPISHLLPKTVDDNQMPASVPSLVLKSLERDFIRFMCTIRGVQSRATWDISSPISTTLTEKRTYTYAVSLSISELEAADVDIEQASTAADAFEIVIEDISSSTLTRIGHACARVRRSITIPLILHTKSGQTRGKDVESYSAIVRQCARLAPDYLTIDLGMSDDIIEGLLPKENTIKSIGHLNLTKRGILSWQNQACREVYIRASGLGFNVVRLCMEPQQASDNLAIQSLQSYVRSLHEAHPPLIAYNTGALGRTSICLNSSMTPVKAPGRATRADDEAPHLTAQESTAALFSAYVHVPLDFCFVAMDVSYTLAPVMHTAAFQAFGIPHSYRAQQCATLSELESITRQQSFGGLSIGAPFKAEACQIVKSLSAQAKAIGAINTIIPARRRVLSDTSSMKTGERHIGPFAGTDDLYGDNTDWIGIAICVLRGLSPVNAIRAKTSALVIGAGSMARAAVYALLSLGVRSIIISNRTKAHAEDLVAHFNRLGELSQEESGSHATLVKNARIVIVQSLDDNVPEGMNFPTVIVSCIPQVKGFSLPDPWLMNPTGGAILELGYEILETPLVLQIQSQAPKGWVALRGLDFLPEQGCAQFELFTGRRAPRRLMRTAVLSAYKARHFS